MTYIIILREEVDFVRQEKPTEWAFSPDNAVSRVFECNRIAYPEVI